MWSDVTLPWGLGGIYDWTPAPGGKDGKAIRITNETTKQVMAHEVRCLQFGHKPGASARIRMDVRVAALPTEGWIKIRHFDGYVTADAFAHSADDEFAPFPKPVFECAAPPKDPAEWQSIDLSTGPLKNTVLTLAFLVADPRHNREKDPAATEFADLYVDNISVETEVSDAILDPAFDWDGKKASKMINFRRSTAGAATPWCDFFQEEDVAEPDGKIIHYTAQTFQDSTAGGPSHMKHDYIHSVEDPYCGGLNVLALSRIHAPDCAASWGVYQTFSYASLGLKPEDTGRVRVAAKAAVHDPAERKAGRVMVGAHPAGGLEQTQAVWSPESKANVDHGGLQTIEAVFDKPAGAKALTVFFKFRDGLPGKPDDPDSIGTDPGCRAFVDWILVKRVDPPK
jgi:hypothetical protein